MMFHVVSIFPQMFAPVMGESILGRAIESGLIEVNLVNIRDFTEDRHRTTDDTPFGGGSGMVMKIEPIVRAIRQVEAQHSVDRKLLLSPRGELFDHGKAGELSRLSSLLLVCGRYEGVDQRVADHYVDEELSIGDYVLSGGELAALVVIEATARLIPGVLGNTESPCAESHANGLLEYPQYTRPRNFEGHEVPQILLSGHHANIAHWRYRQALLHTQRTRPDLFAQLQLTEEQRLMLEEE